MNLYFNKKLINYVSTRADKTILFIYKFNLPKTMISRVNVLFYLLIAGEFCARGSASPPRFSSKLNYIYAIYVNVPMHS